MKNKILITIGLVSVLGACSSAPKRTKWSDKAMRVMVDPDSVSESDVVMIEHALKSSGKWFVVSRGKGFNAVKKEQERQHRDESDRFDAKEKYAVWKKMYGVGGIVVANSDCHGLIGLLKGEYVKCRQHLSVVDASTGEIITSAKNDVEGESGYAKPEWDEVVDLMNNSFPEHFEEMKYTESMLKEREELEAAAKNQEEIVRKIAEAKKQEEQENRDIQRESTRSLLGVK